MSAEGGPKREDNVTYIDEFRRERWLLKLEVARQTGSIAVFNADLGQDAKVIPFPRQEDGPDPEGAA